MEAVAREKFACPACGAEGVWNPAKQAMVCPYCGTTWPATDPSQSEGTVQEHDLVQALRELPDEKRGWKSDKVSVRCQSCQAISVLDPARVAQRCEFCGSAQIVPYEQVKPPISPESLLPFKHDETAVRDALRRWYGSRWFAPNRLKTAALTDTLHGAYLPYWTFDARVHAFWTAESGYYYYTEESYRDSGDSNREMRTRRVQHIRWESSAGEVDHFFDDELVCASRGIDQSLLCKIEPFPTKQLISYAPSYVAGWVVEQYQIDLVGAAQQSRQRIEQKIYSMCDGQVPGDTHRGLRVRSEFYSQTFKHVLLPVWFVKYDFGSRSFHVVMNGVTGEVAGQHPLSAWKIFFLIITLALIGLLIYALSR